MLFLAPFSTVDAQLWINEICAKNDSVFAGDLVDYPDYIELFNSSSDTVALEGWFLSDDGDDLAKWAFSRGQIAPGDYYLVLADEVDRALQYQHTNFKLYSSGESVFLSNGFGLQDSLSYPTNPVDMAFGRLLDAGDELDFLAHPSPASSNTGEQLLNNIHPPVYAADQYFFAGSSSIQLNSPTEGTEIRFTRNGSYPNEQSELYNESIQLDSSTVIRAASFGSNYLPSITTTLSFFIAEAHSLDVISIAGDADKFWSEENGILVEGLEAEEDWPFYGANYWRDVQVPVQMQFFDKDGRLEFEHIFDTEVHGGRSARTNDQKSLRLKVKKRYGSFDVEYPFFEDRENTHYKRLVLRNASGDHNYAHLRDAFLSQHFSDEELNLHLLSYRPTAIYINGEYYGIINLREKSDKYYLQYNYEENLDSLEFLEEDTIAILGDFESFDELISTLESNDLSVDENYLELSEEIDVENLAETFVVESIFNNSDWLVNNIKFWKGYSEDSKWRYLTFDLDDCMGRRGWTKAHRNLLNSYFESDNEQTKHARLFLALLENGNYRNYFINRYADLLNTSFEVEHISSKLSHFITKVDEEMKQHFHRWPSRSYESWQEDRIPEVYEFLQDRPAFARQYLMEYFELHGEVALSLSVDPIEGGSITLNTIEPELPFEGIYFDGAPIELTAIPAAGFRFSHWESGTESGGENRASYLRINLERDSEAVAYFVPESEFNSIHTAYSSTDSELEIQAYFSSNEIVNLFIYNLQGQLLQVDQLEVSESGEQFYEIQTPSLHAGIYVLRLTGDDFQFSSQFLVD